MTPVLLLHDEEILLADAAGQVVYREPGAALQAHSGLSFGTAALTQARAQPQHFNNRYINTFSAQPLPAQMGKAKHHADLIFHHLATLPQQAEPLLVAVPAHISNEQLGLLLGICNELNIAIRGFVDWPLVYAAGSAAAKMDVLDLECHRLTVTQLERDGDQVHVVGHRIWESRGTNYLLEGWMSVVADEFVQRTRFDPLHSGDSEQQVFDQLLRWSSTAEDNLRLRVELGEEVRELDIARQLLIDKARQRLDNIDLGDARSAGELLYTHTAARTPGVAAWAGVAPNSASAQDLLALTASLQEQLTGAGIERLSRVTLAATNHTAAMSNAETNAAVATHLLDESYHAHPVEQFEGLATLAPGEQVQLDAGPMTAIRVP